MDGIFSSQSHQRSRDRHTRDDYSQPEINNSDVQQPSTSHHRQTLQWPFIYHSSDSESDTSISSFRPLYPVQQPPPPPQPRRATWQGSRPDSSGTILDTIVPDYIINYLRGETPETVARRRENRRNPNHQDITAQLRHTGGFYDSASHHDQVGRATSPARLEKAASPSDGPQRGRGRGFRRWLAGWKGGIILNATTGALVLLPTVVFFVTSLSRHHGQGGETRILDGSCDLVQRLDFALHAVINLFVVAVLMGANYAYQILTSPTRVEVDMAHSRKRWLDIGIPSLRNLGFVSKTRAILAIVLMAAAIVTPVMYNAVVITKRFVPATSILVVAESFLDVAPFSTTSSHNGAGLDRAAILTLQDRAQQRNRFTNLTTTRCLESVKNTVQVEFDAVLLVVDVDPPSSSSLLATFAPASTLSPDGFPIKYCLAQPSTAQPTCALDTNDAVLGATTLLILTIIVTGASVLAFKSFQPLATLGDAISSFLERKDTTTNGACLLTKSDIKRGRWASREPRYYAPQTHYWFQTPSTARWTLWFLSWVTPIALAGAALGFSLHGADGRLGNPLETLLPSASASSSTATWTIFLDPAIPSAGLCLLSALPHLLLAILYLTTNTLLSTYFLSHELSTYAVPFAFLPLRTSAPDPRDAQTTSLFLTLPRPYSWLLLLLFVPISLFLSASLRPVVTVFASTSTQQEHNSLPSLVAVPTSILVVLGLLLLVLGTVVLLGFRRADSTPAAHVDGSPAGNPLMLPGGSCSAVISARCRRIAEDHAAATGLVTWGVIRAATGTEPGLTGFSTSGAERVKVDEGYA
ncbi:hypothetical protein ACRALDRAFT_2026404 [Sodiomyces alcalophilus JCM 7366]|uniref:uncharacterized protein n=1 Tax=Sodiomyces alcalophilus JCM 7366 TaxID=591952 RepID=UPI0039B55701